MKTAYKPKRGAGAVLAFLIISVILLSVIGVVYVAMNNPSLRPGAASFNTCDFNRDGSVNEKDVSIVAENFQPDPTQVKPEQKVYDVDKNGAINIIDVHIVQAKSPTHCVVPPEPSCIFTPSDVAGGGTVTVTSLGGLFGEVRIAGPTVGGGSILLGNLNAGANPTFTLSPNVVPGVYTMRVGSFGVLCKNGEGGSEFRVVSSSLWNLSAQVNGRSVTFIYNPTIPANSPMAIIVRSAIDGSTVYDSRALPAGSRSHVWNNAPAGAYRASIYSAWLAPISNVAEFEIAPIVTSNRCDFNGDGKVSDADLQLLGDNFFSKDSSTIKKYDINLDGRLNSGDQAGLAQAIKVFPTSTRFCY